MQNYTSNHAELGRNEDKSRWILLEGTTAVDLSQVAAVVAGAVGFTAVLKNGYMIPLMSGDAKTLLDALLGSTDL